MDQLQIKFRKSCLWNLRLTILWSVLAICVQVPSFAAGPQLSLPASKGSLREKLEGKPGILSVRKIGESYHVRYLLDKNTPDEIQNLHKKDFRLFDSNKSKLIESENSKQNKNVLGPGSTGGGFSYYRASMKNLISQLNWIIFKFERIPDAYFQQSLPEKFRGKLNPSDIFNSIRKMRYSYFQDGLSVAPNGTTDRLDADIIQTEENGDQVILLSNFFNSANVSASDADQNISKARIIFHEITHLYGIGLENDEESYELSLYLMKMLIVDDVICGGVGSQEEQAADCQKYVSSDYHPATPIEKYLFKYYQRYLKRTFFLTKKEDTWLKLVDHNDYLCLGALPKIFYLNMNARAIPEKVEQAFALEKLLPDDWTQEQKVSFGFRTNCYATYRTSRSTSNELGTLPVVKRGSKLVVDLYIDDDSGSSDQKKPREHAQKICNRLAQANLQERPTTWTVNFGEKESRIYPNDDGVLSYTMACEADQ